MTTTAFLRENYVLKTQTPAIGDPIRNLLRYEPMRAALVILLKTRHRE